MHSDVASAQRLASGAAGTRKGQDRAQMILETAVEVFLKRGYARFTMRAVADAAAVSLGNLNYYFPRKNVLLSAMVESIIERYLQEFERQRSRAPGSPQQQINNVIDFWIDDLGSTRTTQFFPELWALANHDREAARLMDHVYERARAVLVEILADVRPDLSSLQRDQVSIVMTATMEGLTLFAGHAKPWSADRARLKQIVKNMFAHLPDCV